MKSCSQNFKKIFTEISKEKGANLFGPFLSVDVDKSNISQIIDTITTEIVKKSNESVSPIMSYDFKEAKNSLTRLSKKFLGLSEEIIDDIIADIQIKLNNKDIFLSNPLIKNYSGTKVPMFNFDDLTELTAGIESMQLYIDQQLEEGMFKSIFINNTENYVANQENADTYEPFVVNNLSLNKNLNIYKNDLWKYIVHASGTEDKNILESKLYVNNTLNRDLFIPNSSGISTYVKILTKIKETMQERFSNAEAYKHIRINVNTGYSIAQAYAKSLILTNFDNFILNKHANKVSLNYDSINTFTAPLNGEYKYKLTFSWSKASALNTDKSSDDISAHSSSLINMLSNIIIYYEKNVDGNWVKNKGLTIGKSSLDSVGAVLNGLNQNFTVQIKTVKYINEALKEDVVIMTIAQALKKYDEGKLSFKDILNAIINSVSRNNELGSRESVLKSIERFLYAPGTGISNILEVWKINNPDFADFIINAEIALINHIRNTNKVIYRKEETGKGKKGRSLDVLNVDSTIGKDFEQLLLNLSIASKTKKISIEDLQTIRKADDPYEEYFNFLSDPNKGDIILSNKVKTLFKKNVVIDFNSPVFEREFKKLLGKDVSNVLLNNMDENNPEISDWVSIENDNLLDTLRSQDTNNALHLIELFKSRHFNAKFNVITQIKDASSASRPTMEISNLASNFNTVLATTDALNFFKQNNNVLSHVEQLLELEGKSNALSVNELNSTELFKLSFLRHFIMSGINENRTIIQPWNFSDKPKIFGLSINNFAQMHGYDKTLIEMTSSDLKNEMFNRQQKYYNILLDRTYSDFKKLDKQFFDNKAKSTLGIDSLRKIEFINEYLQKLGTKKALQEKINKVFQNGEYTEIVEDLHYSIYDGKIRFNEFLKSNIDMYNNKNLFNKWVYIKEKELSKFISSEIKDITLKDITIKNAFTSKKNKIKQLTEYFGITEDELFIDVDGDKKIRIYDNIGDLSKIFSKFLWTKNLIISQYANTTTKDVFLHPAKTTFKEINLNTEEGINQFIEEENNRSISFTKRMNISGASMTIYGKGKHGISPSIKIAIMDDPIGDTFGFTGEGKKQDVFDGGGKNNPFFNELLIWSLPGLDLKRTQKPIGESINEKFATTLKFATFGIDNEQIRNSMFGNRSDYIAMKKMNDFNIYNTDKTGNPIYEDIMTTINSENGDIIPISISVFLENLWIPTNGIYGKVMNFKWIKDTNKYILYYEINENIQSKEIEINTLFDLWEAFGGAFSKTMEENNLIDSNGSIDVVSSIIKKHSLADSRLNLKDKMISMLLPQTAVKKGAGNINTENIVYQDETKKLSYINFDTSFFGVQLQSFHSTDDSETNEITQVISGITENASTPQFYNAVYNAIGSLVRVALNKFNISVNNPEGVEKIINLFVKKINNSSQINNSRIIINGVVDDINKEIPLGNKTIYKQFVSHVISNINLDFIRRKFAGSGSILNPSHGVMKIFEDKYGVKYLAPDLIKLFDNFKSIEKDTFLMELYQPDLKLSEFEQIKRKIAWFLINDERFTDESINLEEIEPLDFIRLNIDSVINEIPYLAGELIKLENIKDYFLLKEFLSNTKDYTINRVFSHSRDLKPVIVTFKRGEKKESIYNTEAFKFSWWLSLNQSRLINTPPENSKETLSKEDIKFLYFKEFIYNINPEIKKLSKENQFKLLRTYSTKWMQRTFDLLANGKIYRTYDNIMTIPDIKNPFLTLFSYSINGEEFIDNFTSRYNPNSNYINTNIITDYVHKRAENIHTNVHKNNFLLENKPLSEINQYYFYKNISNFAKLKPPYQTPYDIMVSNYNTQESIYIAVEGNRFYEKENDLYDSITNKKVAEKIYINEEIKPNGSKIRLSNHGKRIYALPDTYSIFKTSNGTEIILVKETKENLNKDIKFNSANFNYKTFLSGIQEYNIIKFNNFLFDISTNLRTNKKDNIEDDKLINFMKLTSTGTSNKQVRKYINLKISSYENFKQTIKGIDGTSLFKKYVQYLDNFDPKYPGDMKVYNDYISVLTNAIYTSWKYSNSSLSSRIPAQAMQSFQSMDTVAYLTGDANDVYVSHWQLWLQGSDFDIDKLYMMMYEFEGGILTGWSPFFDILKPELSFKLPIPDGKYYGSITGEGVKYIKTTNEKGEQIDLEPTPENTLDVDILINKERDNLTKLVIILNKLNNKNFRYLQSKNKDLIAKINHHNLYKSEGGFKNYIVYNLLNTSDHPSNQVSSHTPISFGVYEDIKKKLGDKYKLSMYDGYSMFKQQEQNSIGKKVIGIAATGLKGYFGLVKYFSEYYNDIKGINSTDNAYFLKEIEIGDKIYTRTKISGLNLSKESNDILRNNLRDMLHTDVYMNKYTGKDITTEEINYIIEKIIKIKPDEDIALIISSILSLATDNAKELMLAKINAGTEFASVHIYLAMLGIDTEIVAKFMTNKNVEVIKNAISRDFFTSEISYGVETKLKGLNTTTEINKQIEFEKKKFEKIKEPNDEQIVSNFNKISSLEQQLELAVDSNFLDQFKIIFKNAQELMPLGSLFRVNQGSKASQEELYKLVNQFKSIVYTQENSFFDELIIDPEKSLIDQQRDYILSKKPYLKGQELYITSILTNYTLINEGNKGIDVVKYFDENDNYYKKIIVDYYNLIKHTFNLFDVLNNLPHFYQMYKAFIDGEQFLVNKVNKYNFLKEISGDIIDIGFSKNEIDAYEIKKSTKLGSRVNAPTQLVPNTINAINDYYDSTIISKFIKSLDFEIDLLSLMNYLGINNINLLRNNKKDIFEDSYTRDTLPFKTFKLNTEYGIAQFRYLMENYIIKYEKSIHSSNGFLKNYVFTNFKNYNLKNKINYYLDRSNFSELEDLEIGMSLLINNFSNKTSITDEEEKKKNYHKLNFKLNKDGNLEEFKLIDLLTLYDLIINEGRFGGNRATIFFSKDIKNRNAISRKFIDFQNNIESTKDYLLELRELLSNSQNARDIFYLKVFGKVQINDQHNRKVILKTGFADNGSTVISVNRYFTVLENLEDSIINTESQNDAKDIVNIIKQDSLVVNVECIKK